MTNLIIITVLFGLFACYLAYVSRLRAPIKLLILPAFMVGVVLGYLHFLEEVGKPANIPIPEKALYVAHRITNEDTIIIWLLTEEDERLYVIPYTRDAAKELEEAREGKENGRDQGVTSETTESGEQSVRTGDALNISYGNVTK